MNKTDGADQALHLIRGARSLGVELTKDDAARLLRLLDELERWNRAYNLTSITSREAMITHHLLDSLAIHGHLHGVTVADVGTGAGFPGLPLAIANPSRRLTLIDSSNKKVRFVAHAARSLGLANVATVHARVESVHPPAPFDTVVARALAPLPQLLKKVAPLCGAGTRLLAMKGKYPASELGGVGAPWQLIEVRPLHVPGLGEERHVVVLGLAA